MIADLHFGNKFKKGKHYRRRNIHEIYGGQQQGGISTPKNHPYIFIFTGDSGKEYGYRDGWNKDSTIYNYTGEGQNGDMEFKKGNKAIREHEQNKKTIYLFNYVSSGTVEFIDEMTYINYETQLAPDNTQNLRQVIIFHLKRTDHIDFELEEHELRSNSVQELRRLAKGRASNDSIEKISTYILRKRAAAIKLYALKRAQGICEACGQEAPFVKQDGNLFLEVHHLKQLSDGGIDDPENVAAICPNCHRRVHYGIDGREYNSFLLSTVSQKEQDYRTMDL